MDAAEPRTFHLDACLGKGGFGEVYRARMTRASGFELVVAVKLLRTDTDPTSQAAQRLRDEARLLGMVRHPSIPQVLDFVHLDGRMALVSEYVPGADLSRCLKAQPPLPPRALLETGTQVADALHAAFHTPVHGGSEPAGIVHRDLKPANIRIHHHGRAMLLDFGIAWTDAVTRAASTQTAALVGSPAYMAPERFDGTPPTPAQDVFALAAVLWEGLVGRRLFCDLSFKDLAALSVSAERFDAAIGRRLAELPIGLPGPLPELLAACLARDPDARPTADALARRLAALSPQAPGQTLTDWCRDRRWPDPQARPGAWVGRRVTESSSDVLTPAWSEVTPEAVTEAITLQTVPALDAGPSRTPRRLALLAVAAAGVLGVGILATQARPPVQERSPPVVAPAQVEPIDGVPDALAPAPPPAEPAAVPTRPRASPPVATPRIPAARARIAPVEPTEPARDPAPDPEPSRASAPTPVQRPDPSPPPAPQGTWVGLASGSDAKGVLLHGDDGAVTLPGRVAPGRYAILAEDSLGVPRSLGRLVVGDTPVTVRCVHGRCGAVP